MIKRQFLLLLLVSIYLSATAAHQFVAFDGGDMAIVKNSQPISLVVDNTDFEGVRMAVQSLQNDFKMICGQKPAIANNTTSDCIIIGSLQSPLIQKLIAAKKINAQELRGKWEKYILQLVDKPMAGVSQALVIAGSDKRGTIYGIYELSRQMGVSPWYWFADVPVTQHKNVYIRKGTYTDGEPKVKYRGIFINDEWPSFGNWSREKFGGQNSKCYVHIFELLLRLKGNYMWPAMWDSAFYDDDPENGVLADKMGIVMGTSHHEPLALAQQDWKRRKGHGKWSFVSNKDEMLDFWRGGVKRSKNWETMYTIGMRGDGDEAMEDNGGIRLMEEIVKSQRQLLTEVTGRKVEDIPQVWALYKEVQDYYDQGMQAPDDVTLLLCDDNWGNIRRVPALNSKKRKGGYGMYYHVDYVGGPRNSKWINISPIPRIWEQMNLCYEYGIDQMWIVNVGDLKPMEYPITFFLDMAWNPEQYHAANLIQHSVDFCRSVFGEPYAEEAARLLRTYAKYNRRVTPEQLNATTFSVGNYHEWERVTAAYDQLALDAIALSKQLPASAQDAWFQLLGYPIQAMANLYDMYYAHAMNLRLAKKNNPMANLWADRVEECFQKDAVLCKQYHTINGGKWNHMMDEIYIGYKSWNNPKEKIMPAVKRVEGTTNGQITLPNPAREEYTTAPTNPTFMEKDGYVTIEAEHFTRKTDGAKAKWTIVPEMGRTLSSITPQPVTASIDGMSVEYDMDIQTDGYARVTLRFYSTLNYNTTGHRYAISFDGDKEQVININGHYKGELGVWQKEHVIDSETIFPIKKGKHTLRIRPLDNGLVLQKILVNLGGHHKSFLWAPETLKN